MQWYLALGDSLAAGYQPAHDGVPAGDHKSAGYAGPVLTDLQQNRGKTELANLLWSGETTGHPGRLAGRQRRADGGEASVLLLGQINGVIAGAGKGLNASTADVATALSTGDWALTTLPGLGSVPTNVARICEWTWMCSKANIHPNDTGYGVLADAVEPYTR